MSLYIFYLFVILCEVNSFVLDHSTWKDMNNEIIQFKDYCENKNCIIKCCPIGQAMLNNACRTLKNNTHDENMKFENIPVYKQNGASEKKIIATNNTILPYFVFVQNDYFKNLKGLPFFKDVNVLEDGRLKKFDNITLSKLEYCIDYSIYKVNNTFGLVLSSKCVNMEDEDPYRFNKYYFVGSAFLTSSVFMVLVFIVYNIIPELQNTGGMIMKAYLVSMICSYVTKAIQLLVNAQTKLERPTCRIISPIIYFFIISNFFWLNIMSFDLWRTTRSNKQKHRGNGRSKAEKVKFLWYSAYSWGSSLLLTLTIVGIDVFVFDQYSLYQPPFGDCFGREFTAQIYLGVPIGILIFINIIFFLMTACYIWRVNRRLDRFKEKSAINNKERLVVYFRLWFLMGVNWILELVPNQDIILFIITNFFNVFVGVTMFIFVCKKNIIMELCNKFNINNRFVERLRRNNKFNLDSYKSTSYSRRTTPNIKDKEELEVAL